MFIAFYREYQHGRDRDNYNTSEITDSGSIARESMEDLLNEMFRLSEHHKKSVKPKDQSFSYEYTSIEWLGVHEIEVKNTFYQESDFEINWDYIGNTSEKVLLKMIDNSELGKKAALEEEIDRKRQAEKTKLENEVRKKKRLIKEQEDLELSEQHDKEEYERLKTKYGRG